MADKITYSIVEEIGVVSGSGSWGLELNQVSWNGKPAVFDLRKWSDSHEKMGKGVTMSYQELINLKDIINEYLEKEEDE